MTSPAGAASELAGAVRTMLGLTRHNRLRETLRDTLSLYDLAAGHDDLEASAARLSKLVEIQTTQLLEMAQGNRRKPQWGPAFLAVLVAGIVSIPLWFLLPNLHAWWEVLLLIVDALGTLLFIAVGLSLLLQRESDKV